MVESYQDIIEELPRPLIRELKRENSNTEPNATKNTESLQAKERSVFDYLCHEEYNANEIAEALGLSIHEVAASLTFLELKGRILQGAHGFIRKPENP